MPDPEQEKNLPEEDHPEEELPDTKETAMDGQRVEEGEARYSTNKKVDFPVGDDDNKGKGKAKGPKS